MQSLSYPLTIQRRIEFSQTDAAGLIHFTTYFTLMEAAEAGLFRQLGLSLIWQDESGFCGFPRVDCQCKFRRPLHFDSLVTIQLALNDMDSRRLYFSASFLDEAGQQCATGTMTTTCAKRGHDGSLEGLPLPEFVTKSLSKWKTLGS